MKKIAAFFLAALLLAACAPPAPKAITIVTPSEVLELHTPVQAQYLEDAPDSIDSYATGRVSRDAPAAVTVEWEGPDGQYTLTLTEAGSDRSLRFTTDTKPFSAENLGLKVNTVYTLVISTGELQATRTFRTCSHGPRNLSVDKVDNVRDLGGWATPTGSVKQGMAYRGGRLNQNSLKSDGSVSVKISQKGIAYMTQELGIRTEIDLRERSENGFDPFGEGFSVLGEQVKYIACPMVNKAPDYNPADPANFDSLRRCLEVFADPEAYPIYFHCSVGTDRTGYIAYLLGGLLGVSKEDLLRDYLFSDFASIGGSRHISDISEKYVAQIDAMAGDTLSAKVSAYLTDTVGVSEETIAGILRNLGG